MSYELHFNRVDCLKYSGMGMLLVILAGYIFYGSWIVGILFSPLGVGWMIYQKKELQKKRKKLLRLEFREGLYALSASIAAGRSIELAFVEALKDLRVIYCDQSSFILQEFELIVWKISTNQSVESALLDFANRAQDEDITNFANVFLTAKRSGGNLVEIMKYTVSALGEKMAILEAIDVLITGKKYEQKILAGILPMILIYLKICGSGFIDALYGNISGQIAMTGALFLYTISVVIGKKIVEIEV